MMTPTDTNLLKATPDHLRLPSAAEYLARRDAAATRQGWRAVLTRWIAALGFRAPVSRLS